MALVDNKITLYAKSIASLSDTPNADGLTAAQLKAMFDGRTDEEVKASINGIIDALLAVTDSSSGADNIGATAISGLTGATVQSILEALVGKLNDTTDSASGADFVGATTISGLVGATVQSLIEALKTYVDTYNANHKLATSTDHDNRYYTETELNATDGAGGSNRIGTPAISGVTGTTVKAQLASLKSLINSTVLGQIPDGSLTNAKLGDDVKVGSLANLTTTEKGNVVGAVNEVDGAHKTHVAESASLSDLGHVKLPETWKNADLLNGWVSGAQTLKYCKDDFGVVRLLGEVKDGAVAIGTAITTLPVGYRPSFENRFILFRNNDGSLVHGTIISTGDVRISGTTTTGSLSINCTFRSS